MAQLWESLKGAVSRALGGATVMATGEPYWDDGISTVIGGIPSGMIWAGVQSVRPPGFLPCDGRAVSRALYEGLYVAIGTTYGAGNGTTTFNVPDFRGRTLVGIGQGLTAEGGTTGTERVLGQSGGAETATLSAAQMPAHTHAMTGVSYDKTTYASDASISLLGAGNRVTGYAPTALAGATTSAGAGAPHSIMQPFGAVNYWIRY